ncbi:MAG TPA: DUF1648 domain-containing protein [Casimicrobiaceae bacterium]|nr:DUF1648 domain-containing protein [Casimicrobiaceae bacterium]
MRYFAPMLLVALCAAGAAILYATADSLPAVVASHFDLAGYANRTMSRGSYLLLISLLMFGLPLLVVELNIILPRFVPRLLRIPARDYWLAPEHRDETLASIATSGAFIGCLITAFIIALHLLVVEANSRTPARIDRNALWMLLGIFVLAMLGWQFFRWRRFRRPE